MSPADKPSHLRRSCQVQSIAKREDEYPNDNQDFAHPGLWALSDGAGGTGFYAAEWAEYLCKNLPESPFESKEAFSEWFEEIRTHFFIEKRAEAIRNFSDILEDYDREGSSSTLVAAWPLESNQIRVLSYGDSAAFHFDSAGILKQRTIPRLVQFTEDPYLLNSTEPLLPKQLFWKTWTLYPTDTLLMASDALSQWVLIQYALHTPELMSEIEEALATPYGLGNLIIQCQKDHDDSSNFLQVLSLLTEACQSETNFANFTRELFQKGQLAIDDYTLRLCSPTTIS